MTTSQTAGIEPALQSAISAQIQVLRDPGHGIEKESLRVNADGELSTRPHPEVLGSALTHPYITTDFSEAQLELITGVHPTPEACIQELDDVHAFIYANLGDEVLWPTSMPCILGDSTSIPIGYYGTSNIAQAKTVYRRGLSNRYGSLMQTISGIHYNFSMPDAFWPLLAQHRPSTDEATLRTEAYFGLIRNFRRYSWLLIYLFGASPAVCKSFIKNLDHELDSFDEGTAYRPFGTSLRMGRLGYQSDAQSDLHVSYNTLAEYAVSMRLALSESYAPYEAIGVKKDNEYQQLNTTLIQIENEFYGTIRPKQPVHSGERPLMALLDRGVQYVEVRCMDLNPFLRVGIDTDTCRFIDTFLIWCLLADSPPDSEAESARMQRNQLAIVERGREPGLTLESTSSTEPVTMTSWATELLGECAGVADLLDSLHGGDHYAAALEQQRIKVEDPTQTPSAQVLAAMSGQQLPFFHFAMEQAQRHRTHYQEHPLSAARLKALQEISAQSLTRQHDIEAADTLTFDEFLTGYLALPEAD